MNEYMKGMIAGVELADKLGVSRTTIEKWRQAGLLKGVVINQRLYISQQSVDDLMKLYPEATCDEREISLYRKILAQEKENLKDYTTNLIKERVYRYKTDKYVRLFVERMISIIKKVIPRQENLNILLQEELIRCWLNGYDIELACKKCGVDYTTYLEACKGYMEIINELKKYNELLDENIWLKKELVRLQDERLKTKNEFDSTSGQTDNDRVILLEQVPLEQKKEAEAVLNRSVGELNFSLRTQNRLEMYGFKTLGQVVYYTRFQLLSLPKWGVKSVSEVEEFLLQNGWKLGGVWVGKK